MDTTIHSKGRRSGRQSAQHLSGSSDVMDVLAGLLWERCSPTNTRDLTMSTGAVAVVVTRPVAMLVTSWVPKPSSQPVDSMTRRFATSYVTHCDAVSIPARTCTKELMLIAVTHGSNPRPKSMVLVHHVCRFGLRQSETLRDDKARHINCLPQMAQYLATSPRAPPQKSLT